MNQLISEEIKRIMLLSKYDNSKTLSEQGDPWLKYACVAQHPNSVKGTDSSGGVNYTINGVIYYANGRKKLTDNTMAGYTCNDPEFANNPGKDPWSKYLCVVQHPNAKKDNTDNSYNINGNYYYANGRKSQNGKMMGYTCNDPEFAEWKKKADASNAYYAGEATKAIAASKNTTTKTPAKVVPTPSELKDIKAFQDWLDTNAPGWATGYTDGIINKGQNGGGYGKYGPRTQKAWATYKDQYLNSGTEVSGENNTQTATVTAGKLEPASGAVYGNEYVANDGKTYVWNGTEYQVKA